MGRLMKARNRRDAAPRLVTRFKCVSLSLRAEQLLLHLSNSPGPQLGRHGRLAMAQGQLRSEHVEEAEQLQHSSSRAGVVVLRRLFCLPRVGEAVVQTEGTCGVGEEVRLDPARVPP